MSIFINVCSLARQRCKANLADLGTLYIGLYMIDKPICDAMCSLALSKHIYTLGILVICNGYRERLSVWGAALPVKEVQNKKTE